jgi:hypothetical protein
MEKETADFARFRGATAGRGSAGTPTNEGQQNVGG